jgi:hypothetical protein
LHASKKAADEYRSTAGRCDFAHEIPYAGVKGSGNTKEGPDATVREMTRERLVVIAG